MFRFKVSIPVVVLWCAVTVAAPSPLFAGSIERARALVDEEDWPGAIALLTKEVDANPGHEAAYVLLMDALAQADRVDETIEVCRNILKIAKNKTNREKARLTLVRLVRRKVDESDDPTAGRTDLEDAFHIDMPEIDDDMWKRLEVVEDSNYVDSRLGKKVPPFSWETTHFTAYACNEELAKVVAERAELYLEFMSKHLFGDREWALNIPLLVYHDQPAYSSVGGAGEGSGGVTIPERGLTGRTAMIMLFQLEEFKDEDGDTYTGIYKYAIESILTHELTHMMLIEFFGFEAPMWMHEACAVRLEQTREHYWDAARLARAVVAGEHFRFRDLFNQEGYPSSRVPLFYEQSATIMLYISEAGPEAMYTFLSEMAADRHTKEARHDAACATLMGIPQEGAVEEFERRWVEWMTRRYARDLRPDEGEDPPALLDTGDDEVFLPQVNELDTFANITEWRDIDLGEMDQFVGVGTSKEEWSSSRGSLRCGIAPNEGPSFLGIRMNEELPLVVECEVQWLGNITDGYGWIGFDQFNADNLDTDVSVAARFSDASSHKLTAMLSDELVLYMDTKCVGRYPAHVLGKSDRDIDYPLAMMTSSPVEINSMRVAHIDNYSTAPAETPGQDDSSQRRRRRPGSPP